MISVGSGMREKFSQEEEIQCILLPPSLLHSQEQAGRREWDWNAGHLDTIRFRLCFGKPNPPCRKQQVDNNFVGHAHDNLSFEVSLPQLGHGFVRKYLERFAYRRLVLWRRLDE